MYADDMARLFRRADPAMKEGKKVRHLMRGVKQDIFAGLIRSPQRTVAEFVGEAATIERALHQRARQYNLEEAVLSCVPEQASSGLRELVRQIFREELQRLQQEPVSSASVSIAKIMRDEIRQALRTQERMDVLRQDEPLVSYAAAVQKTAYCSHPTVATIAPQSNLAVT